MVSHAANKYMKRMYLRWKKMTLGDKEQYERALAGEVNSQLRVRPYHNDNSDLSVFRGSAQK